MAAASRALPPRPNLEQQKKLAKELLSAFRKGDQPAVARVRAVLPDKQAIGLVDAQFVLAREYGFSSWTTLAEHIETVRTAALPLRARFRQEFERRDVRALRRLRGQGEELARIVNEPMFAFDSPALVAVAGSGNVELVDALLELGADPNRKSDWWAGGFHALYHANPAVAERLLAAGAVPDACGAAAIDRADLLESLLAADPARVHERGGDGQTPLHFARSRRVADLLLAAGADINARDVDHRSTPAEWMLSAAQDARSIARMDVARHLVDRGASADIFLAAALGLTDRVSELLANNPELLSQRTSQGDYGEKPPSSFHIYEWSIGSHLTPLQTAAKFGRGDTLAFMRGMASPEQRLMVACHQGDVAEAHRLVAAHPGIVSRLPVEDARSIADQAWAANAPTVRLMLELGFDPGAGRNGGTALHCASWQGSAEIVAALLETAAARALINTRDGAYDGLPLGWCCHGSVNKSEPAEHAEVARLLIAAGADVPDDMEGSERVNAVLDEARARRGP